MSQFPFAVGDHVVTKDSEAGYIAFIDHAYFTLCIHQWENPDAMWGFNQVKLVVFREDWKHVRKIYKGTDTGTTEK